MLRPRRRQGVASLLAVAVTGAMLLASGPVTPIDHLPGACGQGSVSEVATTLLGAQAHVVASDDRTAVALRPGVYPGVRHRLLRLDADVWCGADALNLVDAAITSRLERATRAATVLASAHFDRVTVLAAEETAPGTIELTTHAATNGIIADWVVEVDARGVRRATWTATEFAVPPFDAQVEGLTALPGATMTHLRGADGLLRPTQPLLDEDGHLLTPQDARVVITEEMADGFTLTVAVGDYGSVLPPGDRGSVSPDPDQDTGHYQADFLRIVGEAMTTNYTSQLQWGLEQTPGAGADAPGWREDTGTIYVDGYASLFCLACVSTTETFQVSLNRMVVEALEALGYVYPDQRLALTSILGHEMLHNWQNAYEKPKSVGGAGESSYYEGVARFSESLYDYSHVSHQPQSLLYDYEPNGCNSFVDDAGFRMGALAGHDYPTCYFWMTFHAAYGVDGLVEVMRHTAGLPDTRVSNPTPTVLVAPPDEANGEWEMYRDALDAGNGTDTLTETLANFASMALTGHGFTWGSITDPEATTRDWGTLLERWDPDATIARGEQLAGTLGGGGIAAARLTEGGTVTIDGGDAALVSDDGTTVSYELVHDGDTVAPGGTQSWLVIINPGLPDTTVSLTLS